jgi:hypothetical protein
MNELYSCQLAGLKMSFEQGCFTFSCSDQISLVLEG